MIQNIYIEIIIKLKINKDFTKLFHGFNIFLF